MDKFALPSYGLLILETACALSVLLLAGSRPLLARSRRLRRLLAPFEASPRRAMMWAFLLAFGVTAASFVLWGVPVPKLPTYREEVTGMTFVEIAPGSFLMGSKTGEAQREEGEKRHQVELTKAYWIGRTEVTQAEWQKVMGENPSHFQGNERLPVEMINYFEIETFLERLEALSPGNRFRLPTEAEWERACRAGTQTAFAFGDTLSTEQANFDESVENRRNRTLPVASFAANGWGLFDFHGNVWEWCADEPCPYPDLAEKDPFRSCGNPLKVIRGGSWLFGADSARCALRYTHAPKDRGPSLGFRVVREIKAESP